jgi:hypothetical protein
VDDTDVNAQPAQRDDWGGFVWSDPDGFAERVIADFLGAK